MRWDSSAERYDEVKRYYVLRNYAKELNERGYSEEISENEYDMEGEALWEEEVALKEAVNAKLNNW